MARKESSLDRVLGRIDNLDTINLTNLAQRLARERALLETIFNTTLEGILVIDREGVAHYANEAARSLVGLKESSLGSVTLWRLVPGLKESLGLAEGEGLERSISSREIELTYPEKRIVRLYVFPFKEESPLKEEGAERGEKAEDSQEGEEGGAEAEGEGEAAFPDRFVVMLYDITRDTLSKEEYAESERISSILLLAAGVAHELGNPLNSIGIHLQLASRQLKKLGASQAAEKAAASLEVCRNEVERLDGIVRHFLEAIRPQEPDFQTLNLHDALEEVLEFQSRELQNRDIGVEVDLGDEPPIVRADRNQIKQVFFNVIKNAMDSMKSGGQIRVRTRHDAETVALVIGDSGEGIPRENLSKVFQPYHSTKRRGSGLGLMIAQRIMREHGGQIGIDSKEGVGTFVTLEFPKQHRKFRMLNS